MIRIVDIKHEIGKHVAKIRKDMNMTKKDFSKLIGMKEQYLGAVESGQKGLTVLKVIEICKQCNVSADYLLFGNTNSIESKIKENFSNYSEKDIQTAFEILQKMIFYFK